MEDMHKFKWDNKLIEKKIREVMSKLGISRMPTNKECVEILNSCGTRIK